MRTVCYLDQHSPMSDWTNWYRTLPTLELDELRAELVNNQLKASMPDRKLESRIERIRNILADRAVDHAKQVEEMSREIEALRRERDKAKAYLRLATIPEPRGPAQRFIGELPTNHSK